MQSSLGSDNFSQCSSYGFAAVAHLPCAATVGAAAVAMYVAQSYNILLAGRVTYGVGIGFAMHSAPAYIAETCPARVRSRDLCCCAWAMHPC